MMLQNFLDTTTADLEDLLILSTSLILQSDSTPLLFEHNSRLRLANAIDNGVLCTIDFTYFYDSVL